MKGKHFILIILVVGFVVYFLSLFGNFLWDDEEQVVNNALVHSISNIPDLFAGSTFNTGGAGGLAGMYYKPMMSVVFAVIYTVFGANSFFFHLLQVLIHLANTILVFFLFEHFFSRQWIQTDTKADLNRWLSGGLSLLFLVHPINSEAVVYISALQDVLFLFFGLLALLVVTREKELIKPLNKLRLNPYLVSSLLLSLSLLSKETGFVCVAILIIYLFLFKKESIKKYFLYVFIFSCIYFILRFAVARVGLSKEGISPIMRVTLGERLISIPQIIFFYLKTFVWPKDLAIALHWVVSEASFSNFYLPLIFDLLFFSTIIGYSALLYRKRSPYFKIFLFFLLWFVSGLGIHLQIVPLDMTVAERWFYLPMVGLLGMICVIVLELCEFGLMSKTRFEIFRFVGLVLLVFLSLMTFNRTLDWADGLTLFSHDVQLNPDAFDLQNNLGVELYRVERIDEAKFHFEKSTVLAPYWWTNWNNLGAVYEQEGDFEKAEEYYQNAINNGEYYLAYENYALILIKQERLEDAKAFLETDALLKFPYNERLNTMYLYLLSL